MKNRLILLALFVIPCFGFSQTNLEYGFKAGLNFSGFHDETITSKRGLQIGTFFSYSNKNKLKLRVECLYSEKGGNYSISSNGVGTGYVTDLNYIDIPLLIEYKLIDKLSFFSGFQTGFLIHSKTTLGLDLSSELINDDINNFDFGIIGGFVYKIEDFFLEARYNYGLVNVFKTLNSKNSTISLCLGYKIN